LWSLDYTLGNYIASSVNKLADVTHTYPHGTTPEEWDGILRSIARNFYLGTNEYEWKNPYDKELYEHHYSGVERKKLFKKWAAVEEENFRAMQIRRQEGFNLLQKWFTHLWD
jgi:ABC-type amino acid transport substrate-binding protein